jgi:hypothetical protein
MKYTLGQAAKATGKSKPTIQRAYEKHQISGTKLPNGSYEFDPAEIHRVFPMIHPASNDTGDKLPSETPKNDSALQVEIQALRERLADKDGVIDDLRRRLDAEAEERRKLVMILTDQSARPAAPVAQERPRRRWWHIGKAND